MTAERRIIFVLFALAFGLRVLAGAVLASQPDFELTRRTPELRYAQRIASGVEWIAHPVSPRAPGYPALLAILYLISFKQIWIAALLQAALNALAAIVVYKMAAQVLSARMAAGAAIWFALLVNQLLFASLFYRDAIVVPLFASMMFLLTRPFRRMRFGAISGLLYALLIHVDPQYVLLFPLFAVFIFLKSHHRILDIQYFFVFVLVAVAVAAPWTVRNYLVYRQPIPVGLEAAPFFKPLLPDEDSATAAAPAPGKVRRTAAAVEFWRFVKLTEDGAATSAPPGRGVPAWSLRHNLAGAIQYGPLLVFFILGVLQSFLRRHRLGIMWALTILAYFLLRIRLGATERTRLPVEPLIVLLAFMGFAWTVASLRRQRQPARAAPRDG